MGIIVASWILCLLVFGLIHIAAIGPAEAFWIINDPLLVAIIKISIVLLLLVIWILLWKELISVMFWWAMKRTYSTEFVPKGEKGETRNSEDLSGP